MRWDIGQWRDWVGERGARLYAWADRRSGGALSVLRQAIRTFGEARAAEAAASMSYYALFSLFPLLLVLVVIGSFVIQREQAFDEVVRLISEAIPISQDLIRVNIRQVLDLRGPVGAIGLLGAWWSSTGFFTTLVRNVNRAWPQARPHSLFRRRLIAVGMVGTVIALLLLSLFSTTLLSVLPRFFAPVWADMAIYRTILWSVLSLTVPWFFTLAMFYAIYHWVPNTRVSRREALVGAVVAAVAWEVAKRGFAYYVGSGLANYDLVYGSLGAVVALLFWIYLGSWVTLFGAHISVAVHRSGKENQHGRTGMDRPGGSGRMDRQRGRGP